MRILFILEYFHPHIGGVETLFKHLTEELAERGHHITILTNQYDSGLPRREEHPNLIIRRYPFKNRYLFTFLGWLPALGLAKKADIIHTTSYNAAFPAWLAKTIYKKKAIITFHEFWSSLWFELPFMSRISSQVHYALERIILHFSFDRYVAVSDYTKKALLDAGIKESRVTRIYNGIKYEKRVGLVPSKTEGGVFTFTFFGRLSYSKGLDILVKAAALLASSKKNFQLQIITSPGPKKILNILKKMVHKHNLDQNIRFYFELPQDQLEKMIRVSDAVVVPSYSEGFCFAAVETMGMGVPLVSSGRGALSEVVSGKFTVASEFSPAGMEAAMRDAIEGRWETTPLIKFPLDQTIKEYIALYNELL